MTNGQRFMVTAALVLSAVMGGVAQETAKDYLAGQFQLTAADFRALD